jgi:hypothetical protein
MARPRRSRRRTRHPDDGVLPRGVWIGLAAAVALALVLGGAKLWADRTAQRQVDERVEEVRTLLGDAVPEEFLAFNSGREVPGSVANAVAAQADFVSVDARAARAVIRFQPKGWWSGFTERCIVAVVEQGGLDVRGVKTACVRVDPAEQ